MVMNAEDAERVSRAVANAEARSNGEIVTIVADASDPYYDTALHWAVAIMLLVPAFFALRPGLLMQIVTFASGGWAGEHEAASISAALLAMMVLKFIGVWLVTRWRPLRVWLTPRGVKAARVRARAITCFKVGAEKRTVGHTGILIYLSMAEHVAEIVSDEAIHAKVAPEAWGDAMAALIDHVREGRVADGMIAAVGNVGAILAEHFPRGADDKNELPDRIILL